ncbi:MAG TPA: PhzF family phenazine biosynthesis protein [Chitinophagaceae bacterium]|nr:PhzF family phenazine biosynthesis protein [Chitinophagaceae bacterium]
MKFFQVDAFADVPFKGNSAAVCLPETELSDNIMQQIAMENNVGATAFLVPATAGFNLRWFTPTVELKLCGHGTLAAAHIVWEQSLLNTNETAHFFTKSGALSVVKNGDSIRLNFPAFSYQREVIPAAVIHALGVNPADSFLSEDGRYIIEVAGEAAVKSISPDFAVLKQYPISVVTSKADHGSGYDFISRTFVPSHGVNEDPVTGSSHCTLGPYWAERLKKTRLSAYQASARGGDMRLEIEGHRVLIEGQAVTVIEGIMKTL